MKLTDKCWCGHQIRWHKQSKMNRSYRSEWLYICKWCIKMELRGKKYCNYEHEIATEFPEWKLEEAVHKLDELLNLTQSK